MNEEEKQLLKKLGECYNDFIKLPTQHQSDKPDFIFHIHALQSIVATREAVRNNPDVFSNSLNR